MLLVLISLHLDFLHLFSWDVFVFFLHDYPQSYIWKHTLAAFTALAAEKANALSKRRLPKKDLPKLAPQSNADELSALSAAALFFAWSLGGGHHVTRIALTADPVFP